MRSRQAGLTLVETVLVLLVAALILGGVWMGYSQVRLNQQVANTVAVLDETIQITRDYLSKYNVPIQGVPTTLSKELYDPSSTSVNLMPSELSYAYDGSHSVTNNGVGSDTQIFLSPLGTEFFVQYPNGYSGAKPANYFEVRIRFINSAGQNNINQCLALMPKLIGTNSIIKGRGLVGYWSGGVSAWDPSVTSLGGSGAVMQSLTDILPTGQNQYDNCAGAIDIRLYFSMRP